MKMRQQKKAQIFGEVFIYILAILITSAILIFGYQAIFGKKGIKEQAETVEFIRFKTDLTNIIQLMGTEIPGTIRTREVSVPSGAEKVCFVAESRMGSADVSGDNNYVLIDDSVQNRIPSNVFVIPDGSINFEVKPFLETEDNGFLCLGAVDARIKARFEALGNRVMIRRPT